MIKQDGNEAKSEDVNGNRNGAEDAAPPLLDAAGLAASLLGKLADAQVAVLQARRGRDARDVDRAMLELRAWALVLASIPAPTLDATRLRVVAVAVLRAEDDDASSLARRMVEFAIRQDDLRLQGRPWHARSPAPAD